MPCGASRALSGSSEAIPDGVCEKNLNNFLLKFLPSCMVDAHDFLRSHGVCWQPSVGWGKERAPYCFTGPLSFTQGTEESTAASSILLHLSSTGLLPLMSRRKLFGLYHFAEGYAQVPGNAYLSWCVMDPCSAISPSHTTLPAKQC